MKKTFIHVITVWLVLTIITSCTSSHYKEKIVGDWELVAVEGASSGKTKSDMFSDLTANSLSSSLEYMKIVYSFSQNSQYMNYGTMRGLNETSEAFFMVKTAKRGKYEIDGNKLKTQGDDGINMYEIIEIGDKVMRLKTQDNQVMVFNLTSKEIEQQKIEQQNKYAYLIKGRWKCYTLEYDNQVHNVENQNLVVVYGDESWYYIKNGIKETPEQYTIKNGNRIVCEISGDEIIEIIDLDNSTLKVKVNSKHDNLVDVVSTYKKIDESNVKEQFSSKTVDSSETFD